MDEEVKNTKLENDRLRALNRKFEQNMSDIVKKLEQFTNVTSVNGEIQFQTNNNEEIDNNSLNNTNTNGN